MTAYRTEIVESAKMPAWISPELHKELKMFCVWKDVSIRDFVEGAIKEALRMARDR